MNVSRMIFRQCTERNTKTRTFFNPVRFVMFRRPQAVRETRAPRLTSLPSALDAKRTRIDRRRSWDQRQTVCLVPASTRSLTKNWKSKSSFFRYEARHVRGMRINSSSMHLSDSVLDFEFGDTCSG